VPLFDCCCRRFAVDWVRILSSLLFRNQPDGGRIGIFSVGFPEAVTIGDAAEFMSFKWALSAGCSFTI